MYPELFHIGPIPIRSYGLMLAVAFAFCILYMKYVAKRYNKSFELFLTVAYIMIIGGIVGARLFYVLFHLEEFAGNWASTFNPFHSGEFGIAGLNMYGGVVLAIVGTIIYAKIKRESVLDIFDYFSPTLGLGLAFARIGCFLNGCCFGTPTNLPWGIQFPVGSIPYYIFQDAHIHPAQLYSSLYGVILFLFLHYKMKHRQFIGQLVAYMFMIEAVFRYAIEYVRYYENAMHFSFFGMEPTYNQAISIILFLTGLGIYFYQRKHASLTTA